MGVERWLRDRLNPWSTAATMRWHGGGWRAPGPRGVAFGARPPAIMRHGRSASPGRPTIGYVRCERSPGGWGAPARARPGWSWLPPGGGHMRARSMPWWLRAWSLTPFVDRFAYEWMWWHGYWMVPTRDGDDGPDGGTAGVREPRRPYPPTFEAEAAADPPSS
jgi:hypothetical protein